MTRTEALKIARHLCKPVERIAASSGRSGAAFNGWNTPSITYGFRAARMEHGYHTVSVGDDYRDAQACRREWIEEMAERLIEGTAPGWATLDFKW